MRVSTVSVAAVSAEYGSNSGGGLPYTTWNGVARKAEWNEVL